MKGFNTNLSVYSKNEHLIPTEDSVKFDVIQTMENIVYTPATGETKITDPGYYRLFFLASPETTSQFAVFVNGSPVNTTITGLNKGSSQLTISVILMLQKNDIVTINNHTSANSHIHIPINSGGSLLGINIQLTMTKIAPMDYLWEIDKTCNWHHYEKNYEKFKKYLLSKCYLFIEGAYNYTDVFSKTTQLVPLEWPFHFTHDRCHNHVFHLSGTPEVVIEAEGLYDVFVDIITNGPAQLSLFVNGVFEPSTISGRDSGGNRCIVRQILKLKCGDVLTVRNYKSLLGEVTTSSNPGGTAIGYNANFMIFKLTN
jgi:hypothetical protein